MASSSQQAPPSEPVPLLTSTLNPATVNVQEQSPLFSAIPAEIRTEIFRYALQPAHNPEKAYKEGTWYYRPTHTSAPLAATSVLLTCRRIYLEAALLLTTSTPLIYWWSRPPPRKPAEGDPISDLKRLNADQLSASTVQIFVQQFQLEDRLRTVFRNPEFRPANLILTLRHGDWWWWEREAPIALDPGRSGQAKPPSEGDPWKAATDDWDRDSWGVALRHVQGLKSLTLELETATPKKGELEAIVKRLERLTWEMADWARMVLDAKAKRVWGWTGVNRYVENERREEEERYQRPLPEGQLLPRSMRVRPAPGLRRGRRVFVQNGVVQGETGARNGTGAEEQADAPKLEFFVVELVWKRREGTLEERSEAKEKSIFSYLPPSEPSVESSGNDG